MYGIDVSDNNGALNWSAIIDYNQNNPDKQIEFAMIASSYGSSGRHDNFLKNVNGAHEIGLKCGAYHYSYAINADHPALEAANCKDAINSAGVLLELPVFYDMEDADGWKLNHNWRPQDNDVTGYCRDFINALGLNCGVYASYSWLENYIDWAVLAAAYGMRNGEIQMI